MGISPMVTIDPQSPPGAATMTLDVTSPAAACEPTGGCSTQATITALRVELNPVTSGIDPVPINPAVVAPMLVGLDDGTLLEHNKFVLTPPVPALDFTGLPLEWRFIVTQGSITPNLQLIPGSDFRSVRLSMPTPSSSNFGSGRVEFVAGGSVCKSVDTLIRNIQPDLEPGAGDFRFHVKAHLCTDGAGTSTTRTPAEIVAIMSDVTKVLSQCGIIVTLGEVVTTTALTRLVDNLSSGSEKLELFDYDEDQVNIDVYFVVQIDSGALAGVTLAPTPSLAFEAGVAIADHTLDGNLQGQEAVRVVAHEVTHYLLNHWFGNDDHRSSQDNLMYGTTSGTARDLDENQCIEMRSNFGVD